MKIKLAFILAALVFPVSAFAQEAVSINLAVPVIDANGNTRYNFQPITSANPLPVTSSGGSGATNATIVTTSGATSLTPVVSTTPEAAHTIKAFAGNLYSAYAVNLSATAGFLVIVDQTSVPATGSITNVIDFCVLPANGQCSINSKPGPPTKYLNGIVALITSAASPFTYTTGTVTAAIHAEAQ